MQSKYAEILFTLYMTDGKTTMDWLTASLCDGKPLDEKSVRVARRHISKMVSSQLLDLSLSDGTIFVTLTDKGASAALAAADVLSERVVNQWQRKPIAAPTASFHFS